MPGQKRWGEVFKAYTRSPGDKDHIRVSVETAQDCFGFVRNRSRKIDQASIALYKGGEHWSVGIDDAMALRARTGRQQLVTGNYEPDSGPANYPDLLDTNGAEDSKVLRS
jgi:hypothetical protein